MADALIPFMDQYVATAVTATATDPNVINPNEDNYYRDHGKRTIQNRSMGEFPPTRPPTATATATAASRGNNNNNYNNNIFSNLFLPRRLRKRQQQQPLRKRQQQTTTEIVSDLWNAIDLVRQNGLALEYLPIHLQNDILVVKEAIQNNYTALQFASDEMKRNKELVLFGITKINPLILRYASIELRSNRDVVLEAVSINDAAMIYAITNRHFRNDQVFMMEAIQRNPVMLKYASQRLRSNKHFLITAGVPVEGVKKDVSILKYVSNNRYMNSNNNNNVCGDEQFILLAGSHNVVAFQYATNKLKSDKYFIMNAIRKVNPLVLRYASDKIKNDQEVAMLAVSKNWSTLQYTSKKCQGDKRIVLTAVGGGGVGGGGSNGGGSEHGQGQGQGQGHWSALQFASNHLKDDKEIILNAIAQDGNALIHASKKLKSDKQIVLAAVSKTGGALFFASNHLKRDKEIILAAMRQHVYSIKHANLNGMSIEDLKPIFLFAIYEDYNLLSLAPYDTIRSNKNFMLSIVVHNGLALKYASNELRSDMEVASEAVRQNKDAIEFVPWELRKYLGEFAVAEVIRDWQQYFRMPKETQLNKDVAIAAVSRDRFKTIFRRLPEHLRADKDVVLAAVTNDPDMLQFALNGLNQDKDCWIAAGLWRKGREESAAIRKKNTSEVVKRISLSTRFSLGEGSKSTANRFTKLLNENLYFGDDAFTIYSPNAFSKETCDPKWTRMTWPCRGTFETCLKEAKLKKGTPQSACCWRYSFRWHLEESKRTKGFMLQVVDLEGEPKMFQQTKSRYALGNGQKIELVMAEAVGTKVFQIFRPRALSSTGSQFLQHFRADHIELLETKVRRWYDEGCVDMNVCEVICEERMK